MRMFEWTYFLLALVVIAGLAYFGWIAVHQPPKPAPAGGATTGRVEGSLIIPAGCSDDITVDGKRFLHRVWPTRANGTCFAADAPVIRAEAMPPESK